AARSVPGVELQETRRNLFGHLGELLEGRIGFEAAHLTYARHEELTAAGLELVPRTGLVEDLREVKDEGELELVTRAAAITDEARTFATGGLPAELARAYDVCLRAQDAGLAAVVPGASGISVDAEARSLIQAERLGESFGHGLGHGVGLEVHEAPWLNPEIQ